MSRTRTPCVDLIPRLAARAGLCARTNLLARISFAPFCPLRIGLSSSPRRPPQEATRWVAVGLSAGRAPGGRCVLSTSATDHVHEHPWIVRFPDVRRSRLRLTTQPGLLPKHACPWSPGEHALPVPVRAFDRRSFSGSAPSPAAFSAVGRGMNRLLTPLVALHTQQDEPFCGWCAEPPFAVVSPKTVASGGRGAWARAVRRPSDPCNRVRSASTTPDPRNPASLSRGCPRGSR